MTESESQSNHYDMAVIGGGSAGYAAARTGAGLGLKCVVIDGAERLGGLCILRGCMPSKTLIESANRNLTLRRAGEFGLGAENLTVDPATIISRKRSLIKEFSDYREEQLKDDRFALIRGAASFRDEKTLHITPRDGSPSYSIEAKTMVVATGSVITVPSISGLEETGYLTSDDVLDSADVPDSIIVLGGGAIALEMAHYYEGIGKEVTVIQRSGQLLTGMDEDVAKALEQALRDRGLTIHCGTKLLRVEKTEDGSKKRVTFEMGGAEHTVEAREILAAMGRKPNSEGLDLDKAGVEMGKGRILVKDTQQSESVPHIFAAGDVCGPYEIVHIAIEQGEAAAENAAALIAGKTGDDELKHMDYRLKLYGIFTEPQVAAAGISELDAVKEGRKVIVKSYPFNDHGKSMVRGETHGFVKLIADAKTKEIVGGAVVGPEGSELIHEVVVAMKFHATAGQFAKIPHYHPTLSEIWTYPAEEIDETE